ncbi:unnamed protein product [Moneuplotes crassus]|uniref:Uncharacterized protein n=2 Tax=Euplotes crassus TaxID=5936 RepID=A0AAD1UKX0_EUPCR|nr:unnamed protein product [Moneuplotes crassus]
MEIKGVTIHPEEKPVKEKNFDFPFDMRQFARKHKFDPDIDLIKKGDGYRYATKSEQKKKRNEIKKVKQEISKNRRKGIMDNIGLIIGKSLAGLNKNFLTQESSPTPKVDKNLKTLENMLNQHIKKFKIPNEFTSKDSSSSKYLNSVKKSRNELDVKNKIKKIDETKLDSQRSDKKLRKTLKNWGIYKAQRDQRSLEKRDTKAVLSYTARKQNKMFKQESKYNSSTYLRNYPKKKKLQDDFDSDTTLTKSDTDNTTKIIKSSTQRTLSHLPRIRKKYIKAPKIVDFSTNKDEMNANQTNELNQPHFTLTPTINPSSLSPTRSNQSKLRSYYNAQLFHDTANSHQDQAQSYSKTKIKNIRRKYRHLLRLCEGNGASLQVRKPTSGVVVGGGNERQKRGFEKEISGGIWKCGDIGSKMLTFEKRDYSENSEYAQQKRGWIQEINSLKERLAKEGVPCDTKMLERAIFIPEDIQ